VHSHRLADRECIPTPGHVTLIVGETLRSIADGLEGEPDAEPAP